MAAEYGVSGFKYSLHHGSILAKNLLIKTLQWTWYFLTNFRAASYESSVYLWETTKWLVANLWFGSKEGSYMAVQGSKYLANATYHGTIHSVYWTSAAIKSTYHHVIWGGNQTIIAIKYGGNATWHFTKQAITTTFWAVVTATSYIAQLTVTSAVSIYNAVCTICSTTYTLILNLYHFITTWSYKVTVATWQFTNVAVREYLLQWAYVTGSFIAEWSVVIGNILWKFLRDLNIVLVNVVVGVCRHVYNVVYVVFGFVYHIVSTVTYIVKSSIKGVVYCVTSVFKAIIWVSTVLYYHRVSYYSSWAFNINSCSENGRNMTRTPNTKCVL